MTVVYLEVHSFLVKRRVQVGEKIQSLLSRRLFVRLQVVVDLGRLAHALVVARVLLQKLLVEHIHWRLGWQHALELGVDHIQHILIQSRLVLVDCRWKNKRDISVIN